MASTKLVCKHCGFRGGHGRQRCPQLVVPERCGAKRCQYCIDMPHRRTKPNCLGCDKPWEPEVIVHPLPSPGSGLGGAV